MLPSSAIAITRVSHSQAVPTSPFSSALQACTQRHGMPFGAAVMVTLRSTGYFVFGTKPRPNGRLNIRFSSPAVHSCARHGSAR
jgi:hypothetical protein